MLLRASSEQPTFQRISHPVYGTRRDQATGGGKRHFGLSACARLRRVGAHRRAQNRADFSSTIRRYRKLRLPKREPVRPRSDFARCGEAPLAVNWLAALLQATNRSFCDRVGSMRSIRRSRAWLELCGCLLELRPSGRDMQLRNLSGFL